MTATTTHGVQMSTPKYTWLLAAGGLVVLLAIPYAVYPMFLVKVLCFALFAAAFNLVFGYMGLLAFGHAAFYGVGAYVTAHTAKNWGIPTEISILLGMACAGVLGILFGWLAIRRKGLYFAMITLALAQLVYFYFAQVDWAFGEDGIQSVPRGTFLGIVNLNDIHNLYYFVLGVVLVASLIIYRILNSPFGLAIKAVRDSEARATSLGYSVNSVKLLAFSLSALFSGLAGSLKVIGFQVASLLDVHYLTSADVLLMVLIGGLGTIFGPYIGALILVTMQIYLAPFGAWVLVIQGAVFIVCILLFRDGIVGALVRYSGALGRRHAPKG